MKRSSYEHCSAAAVPAGLRFDVTPETAGKPIEVCFGGDSSSPHTHGDGAPFKRTRNVASKGEPDFFKLAGDQTEATAFRARQAADVKGRKKKASSLETIEKANAAEPPACWARHWRAAGWLCAFIDGSVFLVRCGPTWGMSERQLELGSARCTEIAQGKWAYAIDPNVAPWHAANLISYAPRLSAIARDCYCTSFPRTGCDFCNGTRLPDGAQEIR